MPFTIATRRDDERLLYAMWLRDQKKTGPEIALRLGKTPEHWRAAMSKVERAYRKSEQA